MNIFAIGRIVKEHPSEFLTAAGLVIDGLAVWRMGGACVKANRIIEARTEEKGEKLTPSEKVQETWTLFLLPGLLFIAGESCHVASNIKSRQKQIALASVAAMSETAYTKIKEQAPEVVGKKKAETLKEKTLQAMARDNMPENDEEIEQARGDHRTGAKNVLIYDRFGGKWFRSNTEELISTQNKINDKLLKEGAGYNDFYQEMGLQYSTIGDLLGWPEGEQIEIGWVGGSDPFARPDGTDEPYLVMDIIPEPTVKFDDFYR